MNYIINYSEWRALYEETEQANSLGLKVREIWSKISDKLKKKYGKEPEELLNQAKTNLSAMNSAVFDLPEEDQEAPALPENVKQILPNKKIVENLNESASDWEYWIDVAVDVLSGILDGIPIPGLQLASLIADILHTISYALRFYFSKDENSKIKYLIMTFLGIFSAFQPLGGNFLNLSVMKKIDEVLRVTPGALAKLGYGAVGKKLPFPHWTTFTKWKVKFVYVFIKLVGNVAQEILEKISGFFSKMFDGISAYLKSWIQLSPLTGWVISDYIVPVIDKVRATIGGINKMTGLAELAKG